MPTVDTDRATIYYEAHGEPGAPALVLAHGAGGNRLIWWQQVPVFAGRHRVVVFDHRSFGRSTCQAGAFAVSHFADDLGAVLDAEGIDSAVVVGQSMGGWTALGLARRHPERVRALVLCSTTGGIWAPSVPAALAAIGERIGSAGIEAGAALAPDFPAREPALAHLYAQISALNTGVDPGSLRALFAEEARVDPASLRDFALPALVIAGGRDLLFSPEVMREVASLLPGSELREFPNSGHSTYFEEPAAFNEVVAGFAERHR